MKRNENKTGTKSDEMVILDELIRRSFKKLVVNVEENPKLGDLLKMIELRRKLLPNAEDQKQLWTMLEKIRQEYLSKEGENDVRKTRRRSVSTRRKKVTTDE